MIPARSQTHGASGTSRSIKVLESKGVKVFAVIDHGGEAEKAGPELRDTKVVVFGSPAAGTPLMQAAPLAALDLPLAAVDVATDAAIAI
jgi:uncharacterized protein (DUF302 family)